MNKQQVKNAVRRFSDLIERNKDLQAYSDFKEGMNEGLEIAKDTFEENAEKFVLSDSSTSPTGSENHLSPLRFQTFNRKYFEIGMKLNDFSIQLVKYWIQKKIGLQ